MNAAPLAILNGTIRFFDHSQLPEQVAKVYHAGLLEMLVDTGSRNETPLLLAIRIGNMPAVREILKYPVNLQQQGAYWLRTFLGLSRVSLTPLQVAIRIGNLEAVCLLLSKNPSQRIPHTHMNCRDEALQTLFDQLNPRVEAIWDRTLHAKVQKDLSKLQQYNVITAFDKVYAQWHNLVCQESLLKSSIELGYYTCFSSKSKQTYFYVSRPTPAAIAKDKKELGVGAHWESFIYKVALLMNLEELFLPTKKIGLIDPKNGQPIKMVLQPLMDPQRYLSFSLDWGELVPMPNYIKALMTEMFLIFGDSIDANVRLDLCTNEIIHFDYEFALTEDNSFQDDEDLSSMFQTCLLLLPQAYRTLSDEDIACMEFWMAHLIHNFPQALAYFHARYVGTITKVDPNSPNDQKEIAFAWHQRKTMMLHMIEAVKQGRITTLADFTLACFPAYKIIAYANIALGVLKGRCEHTHMTVESSPNPAPYLVDLPGLRKVMAKFAELNIPYSLFADLLSDDYSPGNILSFTELCFRVPVLLTNETPQTLMKTYVDRANAIEQDFHRAHLASSSLAIRSPLLPNEADHA